MGEKRTSDLEEILGSTHSSEFDAWRKAQKEVLIQGTDSFSVFIKECLKNHKISQQLAFLRADVPERYGYKLLAGEKRTRQRDVILRICYGGELTLKETQTVLKLYEMPELYARIPRDALIMIVFNERPGSIIDVNELLRKHGFESLRASGVQG